MIFLILSNSQYRAFAPLITPSTEQLFNESAIIVVGKITSVSEIQNDTRTQYVIQPQEYLKPTSADMTQSITVYGDGSKTFNPYSRIYQIGDRVLFFLEEKNDSYFIMPYSIWTKSDCNGKQLLALNYSPGDFSITQGNNTIDKMVTGEPINITGYAHNGSDLKPKDVEIDFTLHNTNPNLTLNEKRQVHIDECKGFAQASWIFIPSVSGRYSISVDSHDASGEHFGGASLCCITISNKNDSSSEPINANAATSNQTITEPRNGICIGGPGMCQTSLTPVLNIVIDIIVVAAVLGCGFVIFNRLKE